MSLASDRHAAGHRFANHVGAALHRRGDHHQVLALQVLARSSVRQGAEPAVVGQRLLRLLRLPPQLWVERGADVAEADGRHGHQRGGPHESQRVFFRAQVADHRDLEMASALPLEWLERRRRLMDHPGFGAGIGIQPLQGRLLQHHQPCRRLQAALRHAYRYPDRDTGRCRSGPAASARPGRRRGMPPVPALNAARAAQSAHRPRCRPAIEVQQARLRGSAGAGSAPSGWRCASCRCWLLPKPD